MEQPFPTRDPIEGLRFTFKTDEAAANPRPETESAEFGEPDGRAQLQQLHFGETPLTDPRALGSSALVHVLLIAVASLTVLNVSITRVPEASGALRGELEPVDNRAEKSKVARSRCQSPGAGSGPGGGCLAERNFAKHGAAAGRGAAACPARSADHRRGPDFRLRRGRRRRFGRRLGRRDWPRHRTRDRVLRRPRARSFVRLRHRLLRQYGLAELAGGGQA